MRITALVLVAGLGIAAGCGSESPEFRSEAERDSAIAESAVPGAGGVKSALSVADSAEARRAREDSIASADPP